uniref:Phosphoacetylglucosamine mutase 2-like n=1 Tax=Dermatophagoides pteronyssinus TaxID=6956 RepID=A0A6P6YIT6_DERPT|nr:phosphoacetylglucosamine mutase 2-like [Dermatophagoides pteronyssinus]
MVVYVAHDNREHSPHLAQLLAKEHANGISFDGDADRVLFFAIREKQFRLIDGDRILSWLY